MLIKLPPQHISDLSHGLRNEWLETNGIGGYASSTVIGCNTRKYHGLLVARLSTPPGKYVLLSKYEESLVDNDTDTELSLSVNQYPGIVFPEGHKRMSGFSVDKMPTFKYQGQQFSLTRQVAMIADENATAVTYTCTKNPKNMRLQMKPLLAFRDFHALTRENVELHVRTYPAKQGFKIQPYTNMPPIYFQVSAPFRFYPAPNWYRNMEYQRELDRGFPGTEDLFSPGMFEIEIPKNSTVTIIASLREFDDPQQVWDREKQRRSAYFKSLRGTSFQKTLKWSAHQFFSKKDTGHQAVTAGYPWFLEWGRDAMLALPGLLFGDKSGNEIYIDVLTEFARNIKAGVIPNFLGDTPEHNAYNSADASLWFVWAVQQYYTRNNRSIKAIKGTIMDAVVKIFNNYRVGTIGDIRMLENGLLQAGSPVTQLTWMDAASHGVPVTPRHGCPVEINALWYNTVCFVDELAKRKHVHISEDIAGLSEKIKDTFISVFWLEKRGYLGDVFSDGILNTQIRPNQVFAVSLPYSPLTTEQARRVVKTVGTRLYTPLGLRTLSPSDNQFRGTYQGTSESRDAAYHNGTVWPWLLGHYVEAVIKTADIGEAKEIIEEILDAMKKHLHRDGIGSVSEVFDGTSPSEGKGCISQAWSVAEMLRITYMYDRLKQ